MLDPRETCVSREADDTKLQSKWWWQISQFHTIKNSFAIDSPVSSVSVCGAVLHRIGPTRAPFLSIAPPFAATPPQLPRIGQPPCIPTLEGCSSCLLGYDWIDV